MSESRLPRTGPAAAAADEASVLARLCQRGPEPLARFILTLAHDPNGVGDYVRSFIAGDDLPRCVAQIESSIAALRDRCREYDRRHAADEAYLRRLDHVLDAIELLIIPTDPRTAFTLLVCVIESDDAVENQQHEAWAAPTFERACDLLLRLAGVIPPDDVRREVQRLLQQDHFGHRARLRRAYDAGPETATK